MTQVATRKIAHCTSGPDRSAITESRPHDWTFDRLCDEGARFISQFREARVSFVLCNQDIFRAALAEREAVRA